LRFNLNDFDSTAVAWRVNRQTRKNPKGRSSLDSGRWVVILVELFGHSSLVTGHWLLGPPGGIVLRRLLSWLSFDSLRRFAPSNLLMLYNRRRLLLTPPERQAMREACRFNAALMDEVPSDRVLTGQIDKLVETTPDHGHVPAQFGYHGCRGVSSVAARASTT
jgi:hypothetical protein